MDDIEIVERLTKVEERSKSNTHQINELKPVISEIHSMSKTMVVLCEQMETTNANVSEIKEKVETIEQVPGKKWNDSKKALFNAILGSLGTAIGGGILFLLSQLS